MNARARSPNSKLAARRTGHEPAPATVPRLKHEPRDLSAAFGGSARGGIPAGQIDFQSPCQ